MTETTTPHTIHCLKHNQHDFEGQYEKDFYFRMNAVQALPLLAVSAEIVAKPSYLDLDHCHTRKTTMASKNIFKAGKPSFLFRTPSNDSDVRAA